VLADTDKARADCYSAEQRERERERERERARARALINACPTIKTLIFEAFRIDAEITVIPAAVTFTLCERRSVIIKTSPGPAIDAIFTLREPQRATDSQRVAVLLPNGRYLLESMSYANARIICSYRVSIVDFRKISERSRPPELLSRLTPDDGNEIKRKEGIFRILLTADHELHPFPRTQSVWKRRSRSAREMTRVGMRDRRNSRALRMRRLGRKKIHFHRSAVNVKHPFFAPAPCPGTARLKKLE
jgi:hypothetical protein